MEVKIALAGNPNSGINDDVQRPDRLQPEGRQLAGCHRREEGGYAQGQQGVVIQDLPGIYSLSPYTLEEVVARNYLVNEKPDAIINIVDGTNIERNLYLTHAAA